MRKPSSKTRRGKATLAGRGDLEAAISAIARLRAAGLQPSAVRVGEVSIELAPTASAFQLSQRFDTQSIVREYGGAEIERLLKDAGAPDVVDDEDQPAVRS